MLSKSLLNFLVLIATSSAVSYKASFTQYGSGDTFGSGNCNALSAACSFYTSPGYAAALSQALYGASEGQGQSCGTCWRLTGQTDPTGKALSSPQTIVVKANNLCPANGNPLCAQSSLSATNQHGAHVNFDLCIDSGAAAAFFKSGTQLEIGTATQVDCSEWHGTVMN